MPLILAGRLGMALVRKGATTDEILSARKCERLLASAYPSTAEIAQLRASLCSSRITTFFRQSDLAACEIDPYGNYAGTVEVVCPRMTKVRHRASLTAHYCTIPPVDGMFRHVAPELDLGMDVYVASPALEYVIQAKSRSFPSTLLYGMELCGSYLADSERTAPCAFGLEPATTRIELIRNLKAFEHAYDPRREEARKASGLGRCLESIPYLLDDSASPMESIIAILLTLPMARGGWGIKGLSLNPRIALGGDASRIAGQEFFKPDGYVAKALVGYEYDSREFHEGNGKDLHDRARLASAQFGGLRLFPLTWEVVEDEERCNAFCAEFARAAGKRPRAFNVITSKRRHKLRQDLGLPVQRFPLATIDGDLVPVDSYDSMPFWPAA